MFQKKIPKQNKTGGRTKPRVSKLNDEPENKKADQEK